MTIRRRCRIIAPHQGAASWRRVIASRSGAVW
jgi:hypothetical protein